MAWKVIVGNKIGEKSLLDGSQLGPYVWELVVSDRGCLSRGLQSLMANEKTIGFTLEYFRFVDSSIGNLYYCKPGIIQCLFAPRNFRHHLQAWPKRFREVDQILYFESDKDLRVKRLQQEAN